MDERIERTCPLCGAIYKERPAISRDDNKTLICPDCGTRQALKDMGVSKEDAEQIVNTIHKYTGGAYEEDYTE